MPYIDITDKYLLLPRVQAVMYYPNSSQEQDQYITWFMANAEIDGMPDSETINVDISTLKTLLNLRASQDIKNDVIKSFKEGMIAGDVLGALYLMVRFNLDPEPSMNKAIDAFDKYASATKFGDGTPIPHSDKSVKKYWKKFKTVAHLWAAYRINQSFPYIAKQEDIFISRENLLMFLGVAKELLLFGTKFTPKRPKLNKTIMEPTMKLTECFQIPDEIKPIPLNINTANSPDLLKHYLSTYAAAKTYHYPKK